MKTLKQRTLEAIDAGHTVGDLARAAGVSSAAASLWKSGSTKELKAQTAAKLAKLTGWSASWWATGTGPREIANPESRPQAHQVSYITIEDPPITPWEDVVSLERMPVVPADLLVEVPDEALAARGLMKGERVWFKAASQAQPRNVVLIEANGRRYIRRFTESGRAEALDSAFDSFEPGAFRVVAVMHMRPQSSI